MKKFQRKTKEERRRVLLSKNNELSYSFDNDKLPKGSDTNVTNNGFPTVCNINMRIISLILAVVFVLTSLVVVYNQQVKADTGDEVVLDGTYTASVVSSIVYSAKGQTLFDTKYAEKAPEYSVSITVSNGAISAITVNCSNLYNESTPGALTDAEGRSRYNWDTGIKTGISSFLGTSSDSSYVNARTQLIGSDATYNNVANIKQYRVDGSEVETIMDPAAHLQYVEMREALLKAIRLARGMPKPNVVIDDDEEYIPTIPPSAENNLVTNKTISPNSAGSAYDLSLEAYSTAYLGDYDVVEKIPTDFVIIVDQSGSMAEADMPTSYEGAGNNVPLETIAKGQYYYMDEEGNTYRVFAESGYLFEYFEANSLYPYNVIPASGFKILQENEDVPFRVNNLYYYKEGNDYHRLHYTVQGKLLRYHVLPEYTNSNGDPVSLTAPQKPKYKNLFGGDIEPGTGVWGGDSAIYTFVNAFCKRLSSTAYTYAQIPDVPVVGDITTGMYFDFPMYKRHVGYTRLCYRDNNGNIQEVPTDNGVLHTEYCNSEGQAIEDKEISSSRMTYSGLLKSSSTETRLSTLNTALKDFVKTLQAERDSFGTVDNKVSIVGFSSLSGANDSFENTELLSGVELSTGRFKPTNSDYYSLDEPDHATAHNGTQYSSSISSETYNNTLLSPNDNQQDLMNAINAVTAYGGTKPEYGFIMAKNVLSSREEKTYTRRSGAEKGTEVDRNQIVIFFTDGEPGNNDYANRYEEANTVVAKAKEVKDYTSTHGAKPTIFTIGVFGNSDGEPITYLAHNETSENEDNTFEEGYVKTVNNDNEYLYLNRCWHYGDVNSYGPVANDTIYDYMSVVSSNYPNAEKFVSDEWASNREDSEYDNWIAMTNDVRKENTYIGSNEYYRMASNQESLITAFRHAITNTSTEPQSMDGVISENTVVKDVIDLSNFDIPTDEQGNPNANVTLSLRKGTAQADGSIDFSDPTVYPATGVTYEWGDDKKTLIVRGFDFNSTYIGYGKPQTENNDANEGYKLVIGIEGLTPNNTGDELKSNSSETGIYSDDTEDAEYIIDFPEPAIARYKYELKVDTVDTTGVFDLGYNLTANNGVSPDFDNILINSGNSRELYSAGNIKIRNDVGNGDTVYLEYITTQGKNGVVDPADYSLSTTVSPNSTAYTYYLSDNHFLTEPEEQIAANQLGNPSVVNTLLTTQDGNLFITSKANTHSATLTLETKGEYANTERQFPIGMTITNANGTGYTGDITLGDGTTLSFANGVLAPSDALKLKHGDSVVFANIPAGSSVTITPSNDSGNVYTWTAGLDDEIPTASAKTGTIDRDGHVFHVVYTRGTVTETGVSDDGTNSFIYILAGIGALATGTGAAYVYRKKDEFVGR